MNKPLNFQQPQRNFQQSPKKTLKSQQLGRLDQYQLRSFLEVILEKATTMTQQERLQLLKIAKNQSDDVAITLIPLLANGVCIKPFDYQVNNNEH